MKAEISEVGQKIKKRKRGRQETGHMEAGVFMKPLERAFCGNDINLVQNPLAIFFDFLMNQLFYRLLFPSINCAIRVEHHS
jgi:hypothetical protein